MPRAPPCSPSPRRAPLTLALLAVAAAAAAQNATVCATNQLDWYTSAIGETPCRTYERLRQICDSRYAVGAFNTSTPGDRCDSQYNACCCNSISWNLSNLCMNCQHAGPIAVGDQDVINAAVGDFGRYLNNCGPPPNGTLPTKIQVDVCTEQIDLRPRLYDTPWEGDGAWFFTDFRELMESDFLAEAGKNLTNCPRPASASAAPSSFSASPSSSSPLSSASSTFTANPTPTPAPSQLNVGAIAGGIAGGLFAVLLAVLALCWRRRWRPRSKSAEDPIIPAEEDGLPVLEPFLASADAAAPPPYAEDPRKGAALPPPPLPPPTPLAHGLSYPDSGSGSGSGLGSGLSLGAAAGRAYGDMNAVGGLKATAVTSAGAGLNTNGAATESSRRMREKASGWQLSEKGSYSDAL